MSKFCFNCGAEIDDNAVFCGNCGASQGGGQEGKSDPKKSNRTAFIIAIVVIVIAAAVIIKIASGFLGYNSLLKKTIKAIKNYDIDALVEQSSDAYFFSDDEDLAEFYFKNVAGGILDTIENAVGHDYKIKYEIDDDYIVSDRKFESLISSIEEAYSDFDADTISKIAVAEVELTGSEGKKDKTVKIKIYMTKEDGKWKLYKIER